VADFATDATRFEDRRLCLNVPVVECARAD
jgi:hypothetical protein